MKGNHENPGTILDQALEGMRNATVSSEHLEEASTRARQRLEQDYNKVVPMVSEVDRIQSCDDFRALIPAYLTSSLTPSRRILFEDHIRECVGCRKALEAARRDHSAVSSSRVPPRPREVRQSRRLRWLAPIAAIVIVAVAVETGPVRDWLWPIDVHAVVQTVDGSLFSVSGHNVQAVKAGQRVDRGQAIRTGASSGAMLELADGSRIEMAQRSELSLVRARDGVKIRLARGNVIVSAAKQHGHLYVETGDCNVAVVGTVFSVSSGVKGSRVSVIEGKVQVRQDSGAEQSVRPGEQVFTNPAMGAVPISQEIGWSRNAEALLKELLTFGQNFAAQAERQSMRYSSNLVPLVPADTLVLASLPNLSQPFAESYALFRQRVRENETLSGWWQKAERPDQGLSLDEMANRISEVGAYLGPEVILAFPKEMKGREPILLAEAARPDTLISALEGDLRRLAEAGEAPFFRLARNAAELSAMRGPGMAIYVDDGLLIVSDAAQVQRTVAIHKGTIPSGFSGTPLYRRLEQAYREGAGWLLAIDLQQLVGSNADLQKLGFENVQQLVLEQKTGAGSAASQVTLGFEQQRYGLPAWLGAPSTMGALDFVSPGAYGFSAWITKDAELILDDILGFAQQGDKGPGQHLSAFAEAHGIDLRRDIAEPLGNEVLVAIDGPVLPKPSWKLVFEINEAPRLENTIQWAMMNFNREAEVRGLPTWQLESESVDGKMYYALTSKGSPMEFHYTSWMGYMIVAPSRALLTDAIRIHDSGNSIRHSAAFRSLLPSDGRDVASGIMYQNLEAMAQSIPSAASDMASRELRESIREATLVQSALPKVAFAYGEPDRIMATAKGSFGARIAGMIGFGHFIDMAGLGKFPH